MAAAAATPLEDAPEDEKLLHCSVCQENFHPKSRLPRALPCHHSFCGDCIDSLEQEGQLKCPLCRKVAKVEGPFPLDDTHITYLELKLAPEAEEAPPCEGCPDEAKATSRCQDCNTNLCDACCNAHRRVKIARNHVIIDLKKIAQSPELLKQASEKCDVHKDRPADCFCKSCNKSLCGTCGVKRHKRHLVVDLDDIMKTWKQKVISDCKDFSETIDGLEVKAASLKTILEHMDTDHNHAIEDIEKTFDELQAALNGRKAAILADLAAKVKANRLALEEELATVESQISSSRATRDYSRRLVQYGLPSQFAAHMKDPVLQEAKQVMEALTPARPIGFDRRGLREMETAIDTFGHVFDGIITWTLENIQLLFLGGVYSDAAYLCDSTWRIEVVSKKRCGINQLDLYLVWRAGKQKSRSFMVHYDLQILNLENKDWDKCWSTAHLFSAKGGGWGWEDFMTLRRATNPKNGFVKDGKLCIEGSLKLNLSKGLGPEETEDKTD